MPAVEEPDPAKRFATSPKPYTAPYRRIQDKEHCTSEKVSAPTCACDVLNGQALQLHVLHWCSTGAQVETVGITVEIIYVILLLLQLGGAEPRRHVLASKISLDAASSARKLYQHQRECDVLTHLVPKHHCRQLPHTMAERRSALSSV